MKLKNIYTILFGIMLIFIVCGCTKPTESEKIFVSYYEDGQMIERKKYTTDDFSLLTLENKEGYTFIGWYLDESLETKFDEAKLAEYFKLGSIDLYACWELTKNNFTVNLHGLVNNKTVINPAFTWENIYNDSLFDVQLFKGDELVYNDSTHESYFNCPVLEYNTSYTFKLKGTDSLNSKEVSFTTMADNNSTLSTEVVLNDPFMDNMVIQRDETINFSGVGPKEVLIGVKFGSKMYYGVSDVDGKFNVEIESHAASFDPISITAGVGLEKSATINNVLIGDVFFFSGQSNMQWPTQSSDFYMEDVQAAKDSNVRFFAQNVVTSTEPLEHTTQGRWFSLTDYNYQQYSAICFMAGSFLSQYLKNQDVPVGILSAYQGNTNIANWMSDEYYKGSVSTKHLHYNAMVHPIRHAKVKGVVWYQGCNNSAAGGDYKDILLSYFENYRDLFNDPNLPFYVVGLACYDGDSGNNYDFSYVRESQALACSLDDNAYFISTCDDGDPTFIHPTAKRYIAQRISKSILSTLYGYDYLAEGPTYKSHTVEGNTVTIEFDNAKGLKSKGAINNLYLAGSDGKYYEATAKIVNETIVASSTKVANPVYIKYGFGKSPFVNVFNKDNFSMVPFRTDEYNLNIDLLDYNSLDSYIPHPDGSDMTVSYVDNGVKIDKANDGATYGTVRIEKWGMIAYNAPGFRFTVTGTNSNAKISFRAVEGPSYETWSYSIVDNFTGTKTFEISISDFKATLLKKDNIFDTQCISYVEVVVESNSSASIIINEARFVDMERSAPRDFTIDTVSVNANNQANVLVNKSLFANSYTLLVSTNSTDYSNPIYTATSEDTSFTFDVSTLQPQTPYYVRVIASNELGETICTNDAYVFYIKEDDSLIINNFDYSSQSALDSFIQSNMKVHTGLECLLQDEGIKIVSKGQGWQNFIFVIEAGSNVGMNKLVFDADFSNYQGSVVLEIVTPDLSTIYAYTLDLSTQKTGTFTINLNDFVSKTNQAKYNGQALTWITFNFNDYAGGYILFDDCKLTK